MMKKTLLSLLLCSVFCVTQSFALKTTKTKLIFDMDAANDDLIALIYLINHPKINLVAVTVAGTGEAHGIQGANNVADICHLLNKSEMPIAYGKPDSIENLGHPFPAFLRTMMDEILTNKDIPHHPHPIISNSAVDTIKRSVQSSDEPITILATGPLTNIAEFIKQNPELINKIEKVVFMGGAVNVPGNIPGLDPNTKNHVAEWNVYADPKAAQIVFTSGIPIFLVPLDATNQVPMTEAFYKSMSQFKRADLQLVYGLLKIIVDELGMTVFLNDFYLWDTLAAMIVADESLAQFTEIPIRLDVDTAYTQPVSKDRPDMTLIHVATTIPNAQQILTKLVNDINH